MDAKTSFRVASRNVISQKFDDEILIIETGSGLYYSLRGAAVDIWSEIERGASRRVIEMTLRARYDTDDGVINTAVDRCLGDLLKDSLIREVPATIADTPNYVSAAVKQSFVEPLIERFTDMQNLLLLDPIHEVSEEGWPHSSANKEH